MKASQRFLKKLEVYLFLKNKLSKVKNISYHIAESAQYRRMCHISRFYGNINFCLVFAAGGV
jgi:hypothetical protein